MQEQQTNGKTWLMVVQFILPVILGIVAGYGSVKYTSGETSQRLTDLERQVKGNREDINKMLERQITREEFKQFVEASRGDMADIKSDLREMRKR